MRRAWLRTSEGGPSLFCVCARACVCKHTCVHTGSRCKTDFLLGLESKNKHSLEHSVSNFHYIVTKLHFCGTLVLKPQRERACGPGGGTFPSTLVLLPPHIRGAPRTHIQTQPLKSPGKGSPVPRQGPARQGPWGFPVGSGSVFLGTAHCKGARLAHGGVSVPSQPSTPQGRTVR